jgi:hypothetical protein
MANFIGKWYIMVHIAIEPFSHRKCRRNSLQLRQLEFFCSIDWGKTPGRRFLLYSERKTA